MKRWIGVVLMGLASVAAQAAEIMVSIESNGVLRAEGMEPGVGYTVEWAAQLDDGFTNNPAPFAGLVANSNGVGMVAIPMFFRVSQNPIPVGMVNIPAGINSGIDPYFGTYSLTNEAAFYMDATGVTKAQWDAVYNWATNNNYTFSNAGLGKGTDHPVHTVNWYDCVKWCNARSQMNSRTPCYTVGGSTYKTGESTPDCDLNAHGYRLPTSGEWEYAARGGLNSMRFPWGDTITHSQANYKSSSSYSYDTSPTRGYHPDYDDGVFPYTSPAGGFAANGYGLYDMAGNVLEWCTDWHPYSVGSSRVLRGGSWSGDAYFAQCGYVDRSFPDFESFSVGFRSVLPPN